MQSIQSLMSVGTIAALLFSSVAIVMPRIAFADQTTSVVFDSSSSWTVPAGVTSATVYLWGAGGGGGRGGATGGGAGAYVAQTVPVTPGVTYAATIGESGGGATPSQAGIGGAGYAHGGNGAIGAGVTSSAGGGGGGSTSFTYDTGILIAAGGAGGGWNAPGTRACQNGGTAPSINMYDNGNMFGNGGGGAAATNGGDALPNGTGGAGGTGGSLCTGISGVDTNGYGGGSSAGVSGDGHDPVVTGFRLGFAGAGSGGAAGGAGYPGEAPTNGTGGDGANGALFDSGGGGGTSIFSGSYGGLGGLPGAGGGGQAHASAFGGIGGGGRVIIVYSVPQTPDTTAPTAAPIQTPAANGAGWNTGAVTVDWNWSDEVAGSGIDVASCTYSSNSSGEGVQTLFSTCKDIAGNTATASYVVRIDTSSPTITATATKADGTAYIANTWTNQTVTAHYICTDATSGIAACPADQVFSTDTSVFANGTATDTAGNSTNINFGTINIDKTTPLPTITTTTLAEGTVSVAYSQFVTVTGGRSPLLWSVVGGTLPNGLSLNGATGVVSGTPTTNGTATFTVQVTDARGATTSQALSLKINRVTNITTKNLPDGRLGKSFSKQFQANGGTPPNTWSITSGSLPPGITFSAGGLLTGTPTTINTYSFTIKVFDTYGNFDSDIFTIAIKP